MTLQAFYLILIIWSCLALASFIGLLFLPAPYGRHSNKNWKPHINGTLGWILMELPSVITYAWIFFISGRTTNLYSIVFLILWELHYIHRSIIFPLRRSHSADPMPWVIVLMGMAFNIMNAFLNSYWINVLSAGYSNEWFFDICFILGVTLFIIGFYINLNADENLLKIRGFGEKHYKIPRGGLFNYISCPNYFGEIIEWLGFAIATWSPAAFTFVIWTCANLIPRALSHHHWYRKKFTEYPKDRKAILPFLL